MSLEIFPNSIKPTVAFAMRYPDDIGLVWLSLMRIFDRAVEEIKCAHQSEFDFVVCYPTLTTNPAYIAKNIPTMELDLYGMLGTNSQAIKQAVLSRNIKCIVYVGCDPNETDLSWLKKSDIRSINCEQDSYSNQRSQSFFKGLIKKIYRGIFKVNIHDLYIADSAKQSDFLLDFAKLPASRIKLIHNAVDVHYFSALVDSSAEKLKLPKASQYILSVSQARVEKRVDFLLQVAKQLSGKYPDVLWIHVGDGPCLDQWQKLAKNLGLADRFLFVGHQLDIRPYLGICSFLVHAAERESFGFALVEAMVVKKPVIAFSADGPSEIILDQQTGKLLPSLDVDMFAVQVQRLLEDLELTRTWGVAARQRVEELFSLDQQAVKFADVIYKMLSPYGP